MKQMNAKNRKKGFTMVEILITIGIIAVLAAIAIPSFGNYRRKLHQKELNEKAEIIYTAVQNELSRLKITGQEHLYAPYEGSAAQGFAPLKAAPADDDGFYDANHDGAFDDPEHPLYSFSSATRDAGGIADLLMNETVVDDELLAGNWVIEYDPYSALVYAVFYTPSTEEDVAETYVTRFTEINVLYRKVGAITGVGYYGGGGDLSSSVNTRVKLTAYVMNEDELSIAIRAVRPSNYDDDVVLKMTLTDTQGHSYTRIYSMSYDATYPETDENGAIHYYDNEPYEADEIQGRAYVKTVVLDDLTSAASRFDALYGSKSGHDTSEMLIPGTDLTISVRAFCPSNKLIGDKNWEGVTNSLFGDPEEGEEDAPVRILCGRHLQNLDKSSGVDSSVTKAVIENDIELGETDFGMVGFFESYKKTEKTSYFNGNDPDTSAPLFKPIENDYLTSLVGQNEDDGPVVISGLVERENYSDLGLFGAVNFSKRQKLSIGNISLTGETLCGSYNSGSVGGLVARVSGTGTLDVENVQIYLLNSDVTAKRNSMHGDTDQTISDTYLFTGYNVGGLIGSVEGSTVSIKTSSASALVGVNNSGSVGGLVGLLSSGNLSISGSYADCYLSGLEVGGLVGRANGTLKLSNSYAAGFIASTNLSAGLAVGNVASAQNVYTVVQPDVMASSLKLIYSTAESIDSIKKVYYDISGKTNLANTVQFSAFTAETLSSQLGDAFIISTGNSTPYNLRNQGLSSYPYPLIKNGSGILQHYGDWKAGFEDGALVYYEVYKRMVGKAWEYTYGFFGANVTSTLNDDPSYVVIGDGYGVVYTLAEARKYSSTGSDSEEKTTKVVADKLTFAGDGTISKTTSIANVTLNYPNYYEATSTELPARKNNKNPYLPVTGSDSEMYAVYPIRELTECSEKSGFAIDEDNFYYRVTVTDGTDSATNSSSSRYYYYHPDFAKTVVVLEGNNASDMPPITAQTYLYIRTPRQFNGMGRHYDYFQKATTLEKGYVTFRQERDVDFKAYEWTNFTSFNPAPTEQIPIGNTEAKAFTGIFDGGCNQIKNVSFASEPNSSQHYVGLFGYNKGIIQNVVLNAEYSENAAYYIRNRSTVTTNVEVCMGILTGKNVGTIQNCACAGYVMEGEEKTIYSNQYAKLYLGCMVGYNTGTIRNSQVASPDLTVSNNFGDVWMGGFVGYNEGTGRISNCYDLSYLNVAHSEGGFVKVAGFYADNRGIIENCYCATAISISGVTSTSYGFGPVGGSVFNSYYLDGGTYSYVNNLRSYYADHTNTMGTPLSYSALSDLRTSATKITSKEQCFSFSNTKTDSCIYPYPAYVKDAYGNLVHYGDWQDDVLLGNIGVFYWEHEEGSGTNAGYHFSFIGIESVQENDEDDITATLSAGTSLCTSHDDGGTITESGYGFYILHENRQNENDFSWTWNGISASLNTWSDLENTSLYNSAASLNLADQMKEMVGGGTRLYDFYAINTRSKYSLVKENGKLKPNQGESLSLIQLGFEPIYNWWYSRNLSETEKINNINNIKKTDNNASNYLYMNSTELNGSLTLKFMGNEYKFTINPFFADSLSYTSVSGDHVQQPESSEKASAKYNTVPGRDYVYGVRSFDQLQNINWHSTLLVNDFNFREADVLSGIEQREENESWFYVAGKNQYPYLEATGLSWEQSHDLEPYKVNGVTKNFVPVGQYGLPFTASYNGRDYKIKNLCIKSYAQTVGLFGRVENASITNVSMYSEDGKGVIECAYESQYNCAVGALIGMAKDGTQLIANCASAGYTVQYVGDKNIVGWKNNNYVSVGGLIGASYNTTIVKCSACNDLRATPRAGTNGGLSYVRVQMGGLIGSVGSSSAISDCYTGGTMSATSSQHILYGGVVGNLRSVDSGARRGSIVESLTKATLGTELANYNWPWYLYGAANSSVRNCYTFCDVPASVGSYRFEEEWDLEQIFRKLKTDESVYVNGRTDRLFDFSNYDLVHTTFTSNDRFYIAGNAGDEYRNDGLLTVIRSLLAWDSSKPTGHYCEISNCYYLNRSGLDYYNQTDNQFKTDLSLGLLVFHDYRNSSLYARFNRSVNPVTYDQLSGDETDTNSVMSRLNAGSAYTWDSVTTEWNGMAINGRYSFPASSYLKGQDYPFPCIVQQGNVYVHYGNWATKGPYWQDSMSTMDIFVEKETGSDASETVKKTFILYDDKDELKLKSGGNLRENSFSYDPADISERSANVSAVSELKTTVDDTGATRKYYEVTVEALRTGTTLIYANDSAGNAIPTARLALDITANLVVTLNQGEDPYTSALSVELKAEKSNEDPAVTLGLSVKSNDYPVEREEAGELVTVNESKDYTKDVTWEFISDDTVDGDNPYAKLEVNKNKTSARLTGYGKSTVFRVEATYHYNNADYVGYAHLNVKTDMPRTVGLSNRVNTVNPTAVVYNWLQMRLTDTENQTGVSSEPYDIPSLRSETMDPEPDAFLFFSKRGDVGITEITVEDISVRGKYAGADAEFVVYSDDRILHESEGAPKIVIHVSDSIYTPKAAENNKQFQYRPIYAYAFDASEMAEISDLVITLVLKQHTNEETADLTYTLTCPLAELGKTVKASTVSFLSYDKSKEVPEHYQPIGTMEDFETAETLTYTLPECEFTSDYYDFAGWQLATWHDAVEASEGVEAVEEGWTLDGTVHQVGETITVESDVQLIATWTPKRLFVTLQAEGYYKNDNQYVVTGNSIYDSPRFVVELPSFNRADGYSLYKWENQSTSERVERNARLTDEQCDSNPTYRAVWAGTLTLDENDDPNVVEGTSYPVVLGDKLQISGYQKPEEESKHRVLIGWLYNGDTVLDSNAVLSGYRPADLMDADGHWISEEPKVTFEAQYHKANRITLHVPAGTESADAMFTYDSAEKVFYAYVDEDSSLSVENQLEVSLTGYRFDGWYYDAAFTKPVTETSISMKTEQELWARFQRQFKVTFDAGDGTFADGTSKRVVAFDENTRVAYPTDKPSRSGYTFIDWRPDNAPLVTGDMTITAEYKRMPTITFEAGTDGIVDGKGIQAWSKIYDYAADVEIPTGATKDHYDFSGWYTKAEGEEGATLIGASLKANSEADVTYYAHYTRKPVVTLVMNGGRLTDSGYFVLDADAGVYTLECAKGTVVTLPDVKTVTLEGKDCISWKNGTATCGATVTVNANMTITAEYADFYKVTLNPNGGTVSTTLMTISRYNTTGLTLPNASKTYYQFNGWKNGSATVSSTGYLPGGNVTLTADYTGYVYFNTNGAALNDSNYQYLSSGDRSGTYQRLLTGGKVVLPASGTLTFMRNDFDGWFSDTGFNNTVADGQSLAAGTILYAKWSPYLKVNYETNGGSISGTTTGTTEDFFGRNADGTYTITLPSVKKNYHNFAGWYYDVSLSEPVTVNGGKVVRNTNDAITLYADWNLRCHKVTLHDRGTTYQIEIGEDGTVVGGWHYPQKDGGSWTLEGWYVAGSYLGTPAIASDGTILTSFTDAGPTDLYAVWSHWLFVPVNSFKAGATYVIADGTSGSPNVASQTTYSKVSMVGATGLGMSGGSCGSNFKLADGSTVGNVFDSSGIGSSMRWNTDGNGSTTLWNVGAGKYLKFGKTDKVSLVDKPTEAKWTYSTYYKGVGYQYSDVRLYRFKFSNGNIRSELTTTTDTYIYELQKAYYY